MILRIIAIFTLLTPISSFAQKDSTTQKWNLHFQTTMIGQYHPGFKVKYSGLNSITPGAEEQTSVTSTFYLATRLWKGGVAYFNPELSGGAGLGKVLGVAGALNGETYRVGDSKPQFYVGRIFLRQVINIGGKTEFMDEDLNQLRGQEPESYISINAGKYSVEDFFDASSYSHDPRTQFFNWALMSGAAWDYPANVKGYTWGIILELVKPGWAIRAGSVMTPAVANGPFMDLHVDKAHSETVEYARYYAIKKRRGSFKLIGFHTLAHMGNYRKAIADSNGVNPDIIHTETYGRDKYGFVINAEQQLSENSGIFTRLSWSDGQNETFAFTEIDRSISGGFVNAGKRWKRPQDRAEIAFVVNGLSNPHRDYLAAGGYGFIIGDGRLNYALEMILEVNYVAQVNNYFCITPDYQLVINPAYNRDRMGPIHVFGLRGHIEF
jgi:high affinity Mn2+ porin